MSASAGGGAAGILFLIVILIAMVRGCVRCSKGQADKSLQPTAYLYAHRQLHGTDAVLRFDVAVKNKKPVIERQVTTRTEDQFHRMVELVKRVESMFQAEHFLPNEQSYSCSGCPHQQACRAWHREAWRISARRLAA